MTNSAALRLNDAVDLRDALGQIIFGVLLGTVGVAAEPPSVVLPLPPAQALDEGVSLSPYGSPWIEVSPLFPAAEAVAVTRPASLRRLADPDADMTLQRRRWRGFASSSGLPPSTGSVGGDGALQLSLGLQSEVLYTDNISFVSNDRAVGDTIFELAPIIRLNLGDPQAWIGGPSRLSKYYADLLYVPTLHLLINEEITERPQHFLGEVGRVSEVSRVLLRLDYDERLLSSTEDSSPEDTFTLLEASGLLEYRLTPKTTLKARGTYRDITVGEGFSNRSAWIGEFGADWAATMKSKLGLGTEIGHILFDQAATGVQNYQQALLTFEWKPTVKLSLTSRVGVEWREFERTLPRAGETTPVAVAALRWQAQEKTLISARLRLSNEPSIIEQGALYQELRLGPDVTHDWSPHLYTTSELQFIRRLYDTGRRDFEPTTRIALGYRQDADKQLNRFNLELFWQWRRRVRNDDVGDADRTQVGVRVVRYF